MKQYRLHALSIGILMVTAELASASASTRPPEALEVWRQSAAALTATEFSGRRKYRRRVHVVERRSVYLGRPIFYRPFVESNGPQGDGLRRSCAGQPFGFGHRPRFTVAGSDGAEPWHPPFGCGPRFGLFPDLGL